MSSMLELEGWHQELLEASEQAGFGARHINAQAEVADAWRSVAGCQVSDAPGIRCTVRQAAYQHLEDVSEARGCQKVFKLVLSRR